MMKFSQKIQKKICIISHKPDKNLKFERDSSNIKHKHNRLQKKKILIMRNDAAQV